MKKRKFCVTEDQSEEMSLQITSMADIFTIILVFLLKSFSTGVSTVNASQGIVLPEATARSQAKDALEVEILKNSVLVDQKPVANLRNFSFPGVTSDDSDAKSEEVYQALINQRKRAGVNAPDSHITLLADQRTPYVTLKRVMNSAASAGYVDLQLAVVQPQ